MRPYTLLFLFLFSGACAVSLYLHPPDVAFSQDLGRHILTGDIILRDYAVPKTNLFSYTYPDFPFINHHWLSAVVYFIFSNYLGVTSLVIFSTILVLSSLWILVYENRRSQFLAILFALFLYSNILRERIDLRPEMFSYFFLTVFMVLLSRFKEKHTMLILLLIPLQFLWTNMHIYFPIGYLLTGLFLIDAFIFSSTSRTYKKILICVFLGELLVSFINPNGIRGFMYPFTVFSNYGYSVEENQTIWFLWNYSQKTSIIWFVLSLLIGISSFFVSKKIKLLDVCIYVFFSLLAFQAIRNFLLFVFGTFTIFTTSLSVVINKYFSKHIETASSFFLWRVIVLLFCLGSLVYVLIFLPKVPIGFQQNLALKPGVDFFIANNIPVPMYNNFDIGSYLEYRLYPKIKVFVDGRPEAYPKDFFQKIYIPMQENPEIFNQIDQQYKFNSVFFSHTDQTPWKKSFLSSIASNENWQLVYLDDNTILYVKRSSENSALLERFETPVIKYNPKNILSLYKMAIVLETSRRPELLTQIFHDILLLDPKNCYALGYLAQNSEDATEKTVKTAQYLEYCR